MHDGKCVQFTRRSHLVGIVIGAFKIDLEETVKLHNLTLGHKDVFTSRHVDIDRRLLEFGISHLGSDRAFPDQLIELFLLRRTGYRMVTDISGTYSLMGLLGALAGRAIMAHLEIALTDVFLDVLADGSQRKIAQVNRVGTHIGDQTFLIQALSQSHSLTHRKAQLAGSFLLQRACGERRRRCALHGLHSHVGYMKLGLLAPLKEVLGGIMVSDMMV